MDPPGREGEGVCSNTTTGPYCAVCAEGFKRQGGVCVECDELAPGLAATPLLALFGVSLAIALLAYATRRHWRKRLEQENAHDVVLAGLTDSSDAGKTAHGRIVEKLKIAYAFAQIVSSGFEEFDLELPSAFASVVSALAFTNLDVFKFLDVNCFVELDFYGELLATCTAPLFAALAVLCYALYRDRQVESERRPWHQIFMELYLVVLFCVYAGVTRKIFTTFKCERFVTAGNESVCAANGHAWRDGACHRSFLRADLSLSCDAATHSDWRSFAGLMGLVYPMGVPLFFAWMLRRENHRSGGSAPGTSAVPFIRAAYEDDFYWWEIVELGRKLLLTLVLVFFYEGSASQILVTILVAFGFTLVLRSYKPYKANDDDVLAAFAQALLMLTSLAALCLKVDVTEEDKWSEDAFDTLLTALVLLVPIFALFEVAISAGALERCSSCLRCHSSSKGLAHAPNAAVTPVENDNIIDDDADETAAPLGEVQELRAENEELRAEISRLREEAAPHAHHQATSHAGGNGMKYQSIATRFSNQIERTVTAEDPARRASALAEAHRIAKDVHELYEHKIEQQRSEAREKLEKRRKRNRGKAEAGAAVVGAQRHQERNAKPPPPGHAQEKKGGDSARLPTRP